MKKDVKVLRFDTLQEAWQGINKYLFIEAEEVENRGGGQYGPEWISYDNFIIIDRAWVDPEYDFGLRLGYTQKKWSALVNNYADFRYIDMIKAEITRRRNNNARSYNHVYHFSNSHGSGKDCLMTLAFTKRVNIPKPVVVFTVRTSEVTKRLLFDFLLVQRICEYIYGNNDIEVHFFAPSYYITTESFVMYNNTEDIHEMVKGKKLHKFHSKVIETLENYQSHPDPYAVRYKVHRRSILQLQHDKKGRPLSRVKSLKAKNLLLLKDEVIPYPSDVISKSQRKLWRRKYIQTQKQ